MMYQDVITDPPKQSPPPGRKLWHFPNMYIDQKHGSKRGSNIQHIHQNGNVYQDVITSHALYIHLFLKMLIKFPACIKMLNKICTLIKTLIKHTTHPSKQ